MAGLLKPPYVVVQVPSLVRYKQWPLAHVAQLVQSLVGQGLQVLLAGSGSAADRGKVFMIEPPNAPPPMPFGAVLRASDAADSPNGWLLDLCRQAAAQL